MSDDVMQAIRRRARQDYPFQEQLITAPLTALAGYDLTEEEKHLLVIPNFSWFVENKIAAVSFPRSEDALATLRILGVRALLNLAEQAVPAERLSKFEMQAEHVPLADFTAPTLSQVEQAIAAIQKFLERGEPVAVHCRAGIGRTGTILACYLVWQGLSAEEAIRRVRAHRPGSIETAGQEAVVGLYERHRNHK